MNLQELDSYNLADAVKFNKTLNPRLWQKEQMRPEVRDKLLEIAADFKEFLGLSDLEVKDITVSGSNAGYTYTPYSDIDLHLVIDIPQADNDDVYRELFDAKKYQYNDLHNIKIGGYDVELYVENANKPPVSQGVFSVLNNDWINIPRYRKSTVDDDAVRGKYEDFKHRIDDAVNSNDMERIDSLAKKIKTYRQAGLDAHGELGPENLAYKMLRTQGYIAKLYDAKAAARDAELSLAEQNKVKKPFVYGYKSVAEDATATPDGVSPTTQMFLNEKEVPPQEEIIRDFMNFVVEKLQIDQVPKLRLKKDPEWSIRNHSFGRYDNATGELIVALGNRHIMDVLRTLAHELTHRKQDEREDMPVDAGETGSAYENEANAQAGVLMRDYAELHPEYFEDVTVAESSGYIPTAAQANDPRFKMALTVDVHPGQTGKEANKMALKTNKQGKPGLLIKSANLLEESLAQELELFEQDLFEVKMTSKNLAKLAQDIKGVKVGLEFEMIVPNASVEDDSNQEPDYDYDEEVRDIDDAVNFFDDGDYNYGRTIRNLREEMENSYQEWVMEQIDSDWDSNGFAYFKEYMEREEPFDPVDHQDRAEAEIKAEFPELDPTSEDFEELVSEKLREIENEYYNETWQMEGRGYDRAREEFDDEQRGDYSERDWLIDQGIRYASDVQNEYTDLTWPHWTTFGGGDETDVKSVALDFMNAIGDKSVAISNSYHGSYEKWNGSEWVRVGSDKPDDCFTIEPDGSLDGNESSDAGLEFVSPPIPLEDIGTTMKKVQDWAGTYGAYTGKNNKTSIHTNISVPGYDLKNLDYLKAALLLGDEYVLREFDRIGNSYAKPAIEKVKQLIQQKPEKAKELMDKMKSQLNAEASKLIHSGVTDKFTSINTKDNRVEFRSPGGDYLSIISDNPQKMVDTINRMVVTLDAAMDPNKYKQEYQKKLYKVLTGQGGGREAKTGAKQEMKASDKDLLNIFSRYAAGELPKAALKSFVRQAQLERSVAKGKETGKMWWRVGLKSNPNYEIEVVGSTRAEAIQAAKDANTALSRYNFADSDFTAKPVRPYEEKPEAQQPAQQGNWGIWLTSSDRFVRAPGQLDNSVLRRFPSREAAEQFLAQTRLDRPDMRTDIEVREIEPAAPVPGSTLDLQRQRAAQQPESEPPRYEMYRISDGRTVEANGMPIQFVALNPEDAERKLRIYAASHNLGAPELFAVRSVLQLPAQQSSVNNLTPHGPGPWEIYRPANGQVMYRLGHTNRNAAETEARTWIQVNGGEPEWFAVRTRQAAPAQQPNWEIRDGSTNRLVHQFYAPDRQEAAIIAGEFYNDNDFTEEDYELQRIESSADAAQGYVNQFATAPGAPNWELERDSDRSIVRRFHAASQGDAIAQAYDYTRSQGWNMDDYTLQASDAAQGGIVDVAGEQPATAPQTLTRPGQGQQVFTGEWKIVDPQGRIIYSFGGVGNAQADANRVAMDWLMRNRQHMQSGVEVLPIMEPA